MKNYFVVLLETYEHTEVEGSNTEVLAVFENVDRTFGYVRNYKFDVPIGFEYVGERGFDDGINIGKYVKEYRYEKTNWDDCFIEYRIYVKHINEQA